jgi:hypothetical protein
VAYDLKGTTMSDWKKPALIEAIISFVATAIIVFLINFFTFAGPATGLELAGHIPLSAFITGVVLILIQFGIKKSAARKEGAPKVSAAEVSARFSFIPNNMGAFLIAYVIRGGLVGFVVCGILAVCFTTFEFTHILGVSVLTLATCLTAGFVAYNCYIFLMAKYQEKR